MATSLLSFSSGSLVDLIASANASLATLTSHYIRALSLLIGCTDRYGGSEYKLLVQVEDGAPALTDPFTVQAFAGVTAAAATTLASYYVAANPAAFVASFEGYIDGDNMRLERNVVILLANPSLSEGQSHYGFPGTGSGSASVPVGNTVFVDVVNGDDATGVRGNFVKPFLTIGAAVTAASSGDLVWVRPGTYTATASINKDGVRIWCDLGVVINYNVFLFSVGSTDNTSFWFGGRARLVATGTSARMISYTGGRTGNNIYVAILEHASSAGNGTICISADQSNLTIDVRCERDFTYSGSSATDGIIRPGSSYSSGTINMVVGGVLQNTGSGLCVGVRGNGSGVVRAYRIIAAAQAAVGHIGSGNGNWTIVADDLIQGGAGGVLSTSTVPLNVIASRINATAGPAISSTSGNITAKATTITGTTAGVSISTGTTRISSVETLSASAGPAVQVTGGTLSVEGAVTCSGTTNGLNISAGTLTMVGCSAISASAGPGVTQSGGTLTVSAGGTISGTTNGFASSGGDANITAYQITANNGPGVTTSAGTGTLTLDVPLIRSTGGNNQGILQSGGSAIVRTFNSRVQGNGTAGAVARNVATGSMVFQGCVFLGGGTAASSITATGATNITFNTPCSANLAVAGTVTQLVTTVTVSASVT